MIKFLKKTRLGIYLFVLFILFLPGVIHAETLIVGSNGSNTVYGDQYWTKENSPYIIDRRVRIEYGKKLYIGPGVVVMLASTTLNLSNGIYAGSRQYGGSVEIMGTKEEPVRFIDLIGAYFGGKVKIENAIFENTSILITQADAKISSTTVMSKYEGIITSGSIIDAENMVIKNNDVGISVYEIPWQGYETRIKLRNSVIEGNNLGVENTNNFRTTVDLRGNWWGSASGPGIASGGIVGEVLVSPWLTEDPRNPHKEIDCCSNVLFLPGLQASRLYKKESNMLGTSENRLWEPNRNEDVRKLYLNENGESLDNTIYTNDIIGSVFGLKNIYKDFIAMMNSVVAEKKINEWLPFAYDWRMSISDIVHGSTRYSTTTKSLVEEVEKLAQRSKTGKVSIVAHSNGGLVAKMLGQELAKRGKANIIDKVIFAGVPQLGTPQAIVSMLHGEGQSIGGGAILSSSVARTLGLNMQGGYGLLPSNEYFKKIVDPIISFADKTIGSYDQFKNFITGTSDGRLAPAETDLKTAAVLSSNLLSKSEWIHTALDNWQFPTTTNVVSIVGWGIPTTKEISYKELSPEIRKSPDGDGTVVSESASGYNNTNVYDNSKNIFFNLGQNAYDSPLSTKVKHANILEADSVQDIILKSVSTSSLASIGDIPLPKYMSYEKPNADDYPWMSWITVSVHSPVDIDVYDNKGGHIGIVPLPNDPDSDIKMLEDTIGGEYEAIGDEKYITLPARNDYNIQMKGTGTGTFTFQVQKFEGGNMIEVASSTYTDLPVTPLLLASTTINSFTITPLLGLDVDGNGQIDINTTPNEKLDPLIHLDSMKTIIRSFNLKKEMEKSLIVKIEKIRKSLEKDIEKGLEKGKSKKATKLLKSINKKIENVHWNNKKIGDRERDMLIKMFEALLSSLEKEI